MLLLLFIYFVKFDTELSTSFKKYLIFMYAFCPGVASVFAKTERGYREPFWWELNYLETVLLEDYL